MVKIRLSGLPNDIEAVTRELRRAFDVVEESDKYVNRKNKLVRRYLVVESPVGEEFKLIREGNIQDEPGE